MAYWRHPVRMRQDALPCEIKVAVEEGLELNSLLEGYRSRSCDSVKLRSVIAESHLQLLPRRMH